MELPTSLERVAHMGVRSIRRSLTLLAMAFVILPALAVLPPVQPAAAAGAVGNGTSTSCTEEALEDALAGGGLVTFNCGDALTDIEITSEKEISVDTRIEGNGLVRLITDIDTRAFFVTDGATLEVDGMKFLGLEASDGDPVLEGGAIRAFNADLVVTNSQFVGDAAAISGGAVAVTNGNATFDGVEFLDNLAEAAGGAINAFNSDIVVRNSTFEDNLGRNAGGALRLSNRVELGIFTATISDSVFIENKTNGGGGAISTGGIIALDISRSTFEGNMAQSGGALTLDGVASTITDSTFVANRADQTDADFDPFKDGGAIEQRNGDLLIERSTFAENFAVAVGGAISHISSDELEIRNSTFSVNLSNGFGSAIFSQGGTTEIVSSTLAFNALLFFDDSVLHAESGNIELSHTIIAMGPDDQEPCQTGAFGEIISNGFNLTDNEACTFGGNADRVADDVLLGDLANNGGLTKTHLPLDGSPAIDNGNDVCPVATDQRGVSRPQGLGCEIGAVELVNPVDLCANRYNGDLRVPRRDCASTEIGIFLPEQAPLDVCVNRFNGDTRYSRSATCASTEFLIQMQGDGSQPVCVNRFNGDLRVPRSAGQCASTETAATI